MLSQKDDILTQKQAHLTFTFDQLNAKLIINVQSQCTSYTGSLQPNPFFSFDKVKKALNSRNFQLLSIDPQIMQITIGGMVDLQLVKQEHSQVESLKETIHQLTVKFENQVKKNKQLEQRLQKVENSLFGMHAKHQNQELFSLKISEQEKNHHKNEAITNLHQEIETLKEQNQQLKEMFQKRQSLSDFSHNELKEISQVHNKKIQSLENDFNEFKKSIKNTFQQENQTQTNLNAELSEVKQVSVSHIAQNTPESLIQECQFMKSSFVVCSSEEKAIIRNFFDKTIKKVKLLYRASDNGFCSRKFHEKCDGIPNTLTLIWTEFDKKIGGYTPLKWSSHQAGQFLADPLKESFIFSLTHNDKFTLQIPQRAIYNNANHGPVFSGGTTDLCVWNNANSYNHSYANICHTYNNEKYRAGDKASWERFHGGSTGNFNFKTKEWEVWEIEWQ